jgi:serine/threonine protein kinase
VAKVSDFGLSSALQNGLTHRTMTHTGTISHSAPELLSSGRMSPAADVYAFGIMSDGCFRET